MNHLTRFLVVVVCAVLLSIPVRAQDTLDPLEGANPGITGTVVYTKTLNAIVGASTTMLTRPADATRIAFYCTAGAARFRPGDYRPKAFTAAVTDIVTATTHAYITGDGPYRLTNSGGALPAGLGLTTDYYVRVIDANTFTLALTRAAALDGTAIVDITGTGTGTHTIGGIVAIPAATTTTGYNVYVCPVDFASSLGPVVAAAPSRITFAGEAAGTIIYYWWLP